MSLNSKNFEEQRVTLKMPVFFPRKSTGPCFMEIVYKYIVTPSARSQSFQCKLSVLHDVRELRLNTSTCKTFTFLKVTPYEHGLKRVSLNLQRDRCRQFRFLTAHRCDHIRQRSRDFCGRNGH